MQHSDDDIALEVETLREQGLKAVSAFFERDRDRLRMFIMHRTDQRLLGRLDWDDVLQETFIVVQNRYEDFIGKPTVPFYVWMRTLAGQVLIDLHRKHLQAQRRNVGREMSLHKRLPYQSTSASLGHLLAAKNSTPSNAAMRAEEIDAMRKQLEQLSELDQEILVLRHMEQLTNGEVAHVLDIDKSAATKRYMRALKRLRQAVDPS